MLIAGGEGLVRGASSIALRLGIPSIVVGLTIMALGTSAPELAVSIKASMSGNPEIAMGNIVGSNIFNILFILGLSSLIIPLKINLSIIKKEIPFLIFITVLFYGFFWDQKLAKYEAICLIGLCIGYTYLLVKNALSETKGEELNKGVKPSLLINSILILVGLVSVIYGAKYLVLGTSDVARSLGVSETIIGLTIVACGTSLPEVIASVMAAIRGKGDLAIGNVVGSNLYNILAIGGVSGVVTERALVVSSELVRIDFPVMLGATIICYPLFRSDRTLTRPEGVILFILFVSYLSFRYSIS